MKKAHIFYTNITPYLDEEKLLNAYKKISKERQRKASKYRFIKDRARCVCAELLLTEALQIIFPEKNIKNISYKYGENSKPYLEGEEYEGIYFNYSHSEDIVICGLAYDEIGVDVEQVERYNPALARRFFTQNENDYIESFAEIKDKKKAFAEVWTSKESYIKYAGKGLRMDLKSFDTLNLENVNISHYEIESDYKCAVCLGMEYTPGIIAPPVYHHL